MYIEKVKQLISNNHLFKWSQVALAAGIYPDFITKYKRGEVSLTEDRAHKIYQVIANSYGNMGKKLNSTSNKIIAISNQSGGSGTTTFVSHLAHHLAIEGEKVLLIDLAPNRNLSRNFMSSELVKQFQRNSLSPAKPINIIRNLDLLSYHPDYEGVISLNYLDGMHSNDMFGELFDDSNFSSYDRVIIDFQAAEHRYFRKVLEIIDIHVSYGPSTPYGIKGIASNHNFITSNGRCIGRQTSKLLKTILWINFEIYKLSEMFAKYGLNRNLDHFAIPEFDFKWMDLENASNYGPYKERNYTIFSAQGKEYIQLQNRCHHYIRNAFSYIISEIV